jgi:hypothetical protein
MKLKLLQRNQNRWAATVGAFPQVSSMVSTPLTNKWGLVGFLFI